MLRPTLGAVALVIFVAGLVVTFIPSMTGDDRLWGGILVRAGGILGALWLVLPSARRLPRAAWVGFGVAVSVLVVRPRLALYGLAVAAVSSVMAFVADASRKGRRTGTAR